MKIRSGFVSNSSSSSFICDICKGAEEGYAGLAEVEMVRCGAGHVYHLGCGEDYVQPIRFSDIDRDDLINMVVDENKKIIASGKKEAGTILPVEPSEITDDMIRHLYENEDDIISSSCAICTLKYIDDATLYQHLLNKYGLNTDSIESEIRKQFSNLAEFDGQN